MSFIFGDDDSGKKQTSTTTSSPYPAAKPGMDLFYKDLGNAYKGGALNLRPFPGQTVAPVAPETAAAWQGTSDRAMAGSPLNAAAGSYIQRTLDPGYLTSDSPGLSSVIDRSRQGVNAEFARAGRTFSGAHAGALGSGEGQLRYADFARKAGEQANAAGMAPNAAAQDYFDLGQLRQVGGERQAQLQDQINAEIEKFYKLQGGRADELGRFASLLGGGGPGSTTVTGPVQNSGMDPWSKGLATAGTAASIASLFMR